MRSLSDIQKKLVAELPKSELPWKLFISHEKVYACNPDHPSQVLWRDEEGKILWKEIVLTEEDLKTEASKKFQEHIRRENAKLNCQINTGRKGFCAFSKRR